MVEYEENGISYKILASLSESTDKEVSHTQNAKFGFLDCKIVDSIHYFVYALRQILKKKKKKA